MEAMKDKDGNIKLYDTETEACEVCGIYEFENAWVMQLVFNHIEDLSTLLTKKLDKKTSKSVTGK
jgi:hypothetical protein